MSLATATTISSLSITVSSIVTGRPFTSKVVRQTAGSTAGTGFGLALEEEEDMVKASKVKNFESIENARSCLGYRLIVKNIERVGDHATDIVKDLLEFKKPIKKSVLDTIHEMNNFALSVLDDACLSLFKRDFTQAELTVEKTADITKYEKKMLESTKSLRDDEEIYRVRRMGENIRRISEYASDIAEIVMNMTIEKTLRKQ